MPRVNIHEAKTTLSKLVAGLEEGGEAIDLCRAGKPVAHLSALPPKSKPITAGLAAGQIWMAEDFESLTSTEETLFGFTGAK